MTAADDGRGAHPLAGLVGRHLGHSAWVELTAERVALFTEAVDVAAGARRDDGTVPGLLLLGMAPRLLSEVLARWDDPSDDVFTMSVNAGCERVDFPAPAPVGSRIRLGAVLEAAERLRNGDERVAVRAAFEVEGRGEPACVATLVVLDVAP